MPDMLGYHPSVGELIATFVLAIIAAVIAHPILNMIRKAWAALVDAIAGSFAKFRLLQIARLENRIAFLKHTMANETRVVLRIMMNVGLSFTMVFGGGLGFIVDDLVKERLILDALMSSLKVNYPSPLDWWFYKVDVRDQYLVLFENLFSVFSFMLGIILLMFSLVKINDFIYLELTISNLEKRISALRAKITR